MEASSEANISPLKRSWDSMLILDACRYDYFERIHGEYLRGNLEKHISPATCTPDYLNKVFTDVYDDIVYVSANPFVTNRLVSRVHFDASQHFHRVVEVWRDGWDENLGTVPPKAVNEAAIEAAKKFPDKRLIVHYQQPHYPYVCLGNSVIRKKINHRLTWFIRLRIVSLFGWKIGNQIAARIAPNDEEFVARKVGIDGLRNAYEQNVRLVLDYAAKLVGELGGNIIVTSDHGELLGEEGLCGHPCGLRYSKLVEVPWLEVSGPKKNLGGFPTKIEEIRDGALPKEEEQLIQQRLSVLGY